MKRLSLSIVVIFILAGAFAIASNQKKYDKNRWLKNTLMLDGTLNDLPIDKLAAEYIASLPRDIQIDEQSATILDSQWLSLSDDGRVAIIFTGGMRQGIKVLDLEDK